MKTWQTSEIKIPDYPEFSVARLWPEQKKNKLIMEYMPDYGDKAVPDEEYMHKVMSSLYPAQTFDLIQTAHKNRSIRKALPQAEMIEMTPEIYKEICELVEFPSK